MSAESERVAGFGRLEDGLRQASDWYLWGPYVSERQWGTVREDYSADGEAWNYLPHDHARSRAYRWGEDGLAGFCDIEQRLCLGLALWNGRDPILKERIFGLTGAEANHGEDAKEYWWYLDALPSHAWNRWRYHYPQAAFPYERPQGGERQAGQVRPRVRASRHRRLRRRPLLDHRGPLRQGRSHRSADGGHRDQRRAGSRHRARPADGVVPEHLVLGRRRRPSRSWRRLARQPPGWSTRSSAPWNWWPTADRTAPGQALLFCENETNTARLFGTEPVTPYPKDGINDHVIHGAATVNPERRGTKCAFWYKLEVPPGGTVELRLRLRPAAPRRRRRPRRSAETSSASSRPGASEADEFYAELHPGDGQRGRGPGHAAGVRRAAVEQAVLLLRRGPLAGRGSGAAAAARGAPTRAQRPVAQLQLLRHHVDAGQVGVPVVRRVGPGLPLRGAGPRRPGVRQVPADPALPGVVPAPERGAAGLRVGLRRREPPGAGLGRARGVRHRRGPRPRLPVPGLRQAAGQLHLVGEHGGRRRQQRVRGRLPRAGQHRPDRPVPPAGRRHPGAVGRDRLDGVLRHRHGGRSRSCSTGAASGRKPTWS